MNDFICYSPALVHYHLLRFQSLRSRVSPGLHPRFILSSALHNIILLPCSYFLHLHSPPIHAPPREVHTCNAGIIGQDSEPRSGFTYGTTTTVLTAIAASVLPPVLWLRAVSRIVSVGLAIPALRLALGLAKWTDAGVMSWFAAACAF
jgi:hypothetical protein